MGYAFTDISGSWCSLLGYTALEQFVTGTVREEEWTPLLTVASDAYCSHADGSFRSHSHFGLFRKELAWLSSHGFVFRSLVAYGFDVVVSIVVVVVCEQDFVATRSF